MKIERGKKYIYKGYTWSDFTRGFVYKSEHDGFITDNYGFINHRISEGYAEKNFTLVEKPITEEPTTEELLKRIEELEKKVADLLTMQTIESMVSITKTIADWADKIQPKPSFKKVGVSKKGKFKAIADHANAINDIIKNAPE